MSKVVTGTVRLSYANIWNPVSINGSDEKYSVSLIIPKSDKQTVKLIQDAIEQAKQDAEISGTRRTQVGTGDRSAKIRTYNFPQNRVTDHRIGLTLYSLDSFLDGEIGAMIDALIASDTANKLKDSGFTA